MNTLVRINSGKNWHHIDNELLDMILKYKNKQISLTELYGAFIKYFCKKNGSLLEKFPSFLQSVVEISRVSLTVSTLCFIFLTRLTVLSILESFIGYFRKSLLVDYPDFFLSFKPKFSRLTITKDKRNILCITPNIVIGGAEKLTLNIAQAVGSERYSFHLLTTTPANNIWRDKFQPYFQNIITPMDKTAETYYSGEIDHKRLHYLIKKLNIEIVLINQYRGAYLEYIPQLKSKFKNISIVDVVHNEVNPGIHRMKQSAPYIDRRICISNRVKNYVTKIYKELSTDETYSEQLSVIHNGIDSREFTADPQTRGRFKTEFSIPIDVKIISFIGRVSDEKNPLLFVDIAKSVLAKSPEKIKFVIAGDGPDFEKVSNRIKDYGLEADFILTRMIDNVAELLNDTYVLLIVSKREGIPLAVLEAMSMGVPVISKNVGALNEVIENNVNGFLINSENDVAQVVESFSNAIFDLLTAKTDYSLLAKRARETIISGFCLETMGSKYKRVFDELIKD
jgi:glycosyltransferase involved in cell wall biosynthesis